MGNSNKYPRVEQELNRVPGILMCGSDNAPVIVEHPRDKPGIVILVHGVNDVGMGYAAAEEGLCAGLGKRLYRRFTPATYKLPTQADKDNVEHDPDAVYFKRDIKKPIDSPLIPFYWGYRELEDEAKTKNGQNIDRHGNRLDADRSKGGGPFGNATSNLPDMWNRGLGAPLDPVGDPLRPIFDGPGRMYMVLAALRLACLISAIRQYESKDTVSIVAHSQGCLLSLLAQALLMERGERPADTLILTHPPYSLEEHPHELKLRGASYFQGGSDPLMKQSDYEQIAGWQSLHGRLQTLVNIVQSVAKEKASEPAFHSITEASCLGAVECRWQPGEDRDNRGKVFLYFCPEDMTVALDNMRGIGWQGVPDYMEGAQAGYESRDRKLGRGSDYDRLNHYEWSAGTTKRMPLKELGEGFRQRVFTAKMRLDPRTHKSGPVLVGAPLHDFALRVKGEDDHAHVAASERDDRASLPLAVWPIDPRDKPEDQRYGICRINAEPLKSPCVADIHGNEIAAAQIPASSRLAKVPLKERGPCEDVDPITAAIAVAGPQGVRTWSEQRPDPVHTMPPSAIPPDAKAHGSTGDRAGPPGSPDALPQHELDWMTQAYNREKLSPELRAGKDDFPEDDKFKIVRAVRWPDGRVVAQVRESPNAARRRWQKEVGPKSFHSAIFESRENHRRVTAYDVAIGSGKAASDPLFYQYLCALADWRLKKPKRGDPPRKDILTWEKFMKQFGIYYACEPEWRRQVIEGNVLYYSSGELPLCLPPLKGKLWDIVISETTAGKRVNKPEALKGHV